MKSLDEQLDDLDRNWKLAQSALNRLEKRRGELHRRQRELRDRRERLALMKLIGLPVTLKAGAAKYLSARFCQAAATGMVLVKVGRTRATVELGNAESWKIPLDSIQDPAAGLSAGMIL